MAITGKSYKEVDFDNLGLASQAQAMQEPLKEGFMSRLYTKSYRAQKEAAQVQAIQELLQLLEENPKIARILELVDQVGGYVY